MLQGVLVGHKDIGGLLIKTFKMPYFYFSVQPSMELSSHAAIATRATEMVERLSDENQSLRQEIEGYHGKVNKLHKVSKSISHYIFFIDMLSGTCQVAKFANKYNKQTPAVGLKH